MDIRYWPRPRVDGWTRKLPVDASLDQSIGLVDWEARHRCRVSGLPDEALLPSGQTARACDQISVCSEISRASSTSMPRYLTVDSSLAWPSSNCTARRFFVRR